MIVLLRFIGVMNAALWFGAGLFFTFGVAPTFFSQEMKNILGAQAPIPGADMRADAFAGLIAQLALGKYYILNYWCAGIALVHLLAEWVYLGKTIHRATLGILLGAFSVMLISGIWIQPKLSELHQVRYYEQFYQNASPYPAAQKRAAARRFSFWHGVSQVMNLMVLGGLGVYLWRVTHSSDAPRFVSSNKFRS